MTSRRSGDREDRGILVSDDPLWFKDATIYQIHVRAYADDTGDGRGDFRGLAGRLDYLRDLGVSAIWLLPFYPSPLRDDGYDIADYTQVHPDYGTLADFRHFLREAHKRGLRVITELVMNHTSDQHPWFQRARRAPAGSPERDFYVWSDTADRYRDTRIIFKDFESSNWTWDPVAKAYFWHRFYHHQPDLNFENQAVRKAMFQVMDYWLGMGVDGLRLDAVPYLHEREGTNCENLPETHEELKALRRQVDAKHRARMLLAEANQWPEDAVAYFGEGDECHMAFHFPVMPRMFMALRMEDRYPIIDILKQTPAIPETCQWALFLRNHDELTLEMVTDEERDYMYRVYANDPRARINLGIRRRLAPLLGNDRRRMELMNGLLFSLPGTPVIYYGDEIGMGDNIYLGDRNGVRTPMQWSADRNAGFSRANTQRLYLPVIIDAEFHYEAINVEAQQNNPSSLLWWMRRMIALRKRHKAFGRGGIEFLYPENRKVLAFLRRHESELILVVANLSRHAQYVELGLSEFKGMFPQELLGRTPFPPIGDLPYLLTLGPHAFYWFSLQPDRATIEQASSPAVLTLRVPGEWQAIFGTEHRGALEEVLTAYLRRQRWFGGKARVIESVDLVDAVPVAAGGLKAAVALVRVGYTEGDPETYQLPLCFSLEPRASQVTEWSPQEVVARLSTKPGEGVLHGALVEREFCLAVLDLVARRKQAKGAAGEIAGLTTKAFRKIRGGDAAPPEPSLLRAEQSNSSVMFGDRMILKIFRRVDEGINPDLELGAFLTERTSFDRIPPVAGAVEYRPRGREAMTLGILQGFVPNEGDAWRYTLDILSRYFERVVGRAAEQDTLIAPAGSLLELSRQEPDGPVREAIGVYLESAGLLGCRTAELHHALASSPEDPAFIPEPFTPFYQRSLFQSMRNQVDQVFELLRKRLAMVPEEARPLAEQLLESGDAVMGRLHRIRDRKITALRTRIHGDYHLGQVLFTGKDFVIIDFEGEPAYSLSARRIKRSPLRDVAGMLRSFDYAGHTALADQIESGDLPAGELDRLEQAATFWIRWISAAFLRAYLERIAGAGLVPDDPGQAEALLAACLLEKGLYEIAYELNNRPEWVRIPLQGVLRLIGPAE